MPGTFLTLALLAATLQAPVDSASGIRGKASSAINGQPLVGVTIAAIEHRPQPGSDSAVTAVTKSVVTDSSGERRVSRNSQTYSEAHASAPAPSNASV